MAGLLLAALHCSNVHAGVRVEGDARDVHVEARDATVAEILAALAERFALRYRGASGSGGVTANFDGPLRRVVARVLERYNFVIRERADGLDVTVLDTSSPNAVVPPRLPPPSFPSSRQRED
jgi:hypothetical protein